MKSREITKINGQWPDLTRFIGEQVDSAELRQSDTALVLTFQSGGVAVAPAHWQYSSCLLAISSAEFDSANNDPENTSELVGLCGAKLTGVESDKDHFDLILGSIRISVTAVSQTKP